MLVCWVISRRWRLSRATALISPSISLMKGLVLADLEDFTGKYPIAWGDLLLDKIDLEYDDVNKGDHPVQEIHILNNGEKTMTPNVMHLPPYLTALVTPEKLEPLKAGTIAITLNSENFVTSV